MGRKRKKKKKVGRSLRQSTFSFEDKCKAEVHLVSSSATSLSTPADIMLHPMREQSEVRNAKEDWTGVTSPATRRKLQNRLNQRRYRRARADPCRRAQPPGPVATHAVHPELAYTFRGLIRAVISNSSADAMSYINQLCAEMSPEAVEQVAEEFERMVRRCFLGSPKVDMLFTLTRFNVFRALASNSKSLGWGVEWLKCEEATSPWNGASRGSPDSVPPNLRPTQIQVLVEHHPWIDLWPISRMRDNMLLADGCYDENELCNTLVEFQDPPSEQSGLIVWGDPLDAASWELTEAFVRRWAWVIEGCTGLFESTNRWRISRGEKPIVFSPFERGHTCT